MIGLLRRKQILFISVFLAGIVILMVPASQGEKFAAICLGVTAAALAILSQFYSGILDETLDHSKVTLGYYTEETNFSGKIVHDYAGLLAKMYEHDPVVADQYRQRLTAALLEHSPELRASVVERERQAGLN